MGFIAHRRRRRLQQIIECDINPPEVADVAPIDGVGVVTEVVVGQLLQSGRLSVDGGSAGEVGIEGDLLGVHCGLRDVIDDTTMNAPFDLKAKLTAPACGVIAETKG